MYADIAGPRRLPIEPLRSWLQVRMNQIGGRDRLAVALGMDTSALKRLMEQQRFVGLQVADRLFTAAEEPHTFAILYPLDEPEQSFRSKRRPSSLEPSEVKDRWCSGCREIVTTNGTSACPSCQLATNPVR